MAFALRNFRSAGCSIARAGTLATGKAASWLTTDHTGMRQAVDSMPELGLFDAAKYIFTQLLFAVLAAILSGVLFMLMIACTAI